MPIEYHYGKFPPKNLDWPRLQLLIGPANLALGEFKGLLDAIPNPHILLAPLTAQEAVLTSRIEGTEVTLAQVLKYEKFSIHQIFILANILRQKEKFTMKAC